MDDINAGSDDHTAKNRRADEHTLPLIINLFNGTTPELAHLLDQLVRRVLTELAVYL